MALSCLVFLGSRLARLDDRFAFCSKLIPQSSEPSFFYRNCLFFFSTIFSKYGSLPDDLSCKHIYYLLFDCPGAPPKSAGFSGSVVGRHINRWASVWHKSRLKAAGDKLLMNKFIRQNFGGSLTLKNFRS